MKITKIYTIAFCLTLTGVIFLSHFAAPSVFAATNIKVIEQKVKKNAQNKINQQQNQVNSAPTLVNTQVPTPSAALGIVLPVEHAPIYKEIIITSWMEGKIKIRDVSGQLYLTIFR